MNDTIHTKELKVNITHVEVAKEEVDDVFEFNTKDYLPVGFNAYILIEYEVVLEEEDAPFDFDTKDYLPIGFGLKKSILNSIEEIEIEEADEPFDFDTKEYLPKGFKASKEATLPITI